MYTDLLLLADSIDMRSQGKPWLPHLVQFGWNRQPDGGVASLESSLFFLSFESRITTDLEATVYPAARDGQF